MKQMKQNFFVRKFAWILLAGLMSSTLNVGVVLADDVTNQLDISVDADLEILALTYPGPNGTVTYDTIARGGDGDSGCNIDGLAQFVTFLVSTSNPSVATVALPLITFNFLGGACNDQEPIQVVPHAPGTANITLTPLINTTGGSYNVAPAAFTVNVTEPTGTLTVNTVVINDSGGTRDVSDFPAFIGTGAVVNGASNQVPTGNYVVSQSGSLGYTSTFSGDCDTSGNVTVGALEDKTCTITNDDISPQLIVIKDLRNDSNGGDAKAEDFTFTVSGSQVSSPSFPANQSGTTVTLNAGTYFVSESMDSRYQTTYQDGCAGSIYLGQIKTCIVVNDDIAPVVQSQGSSSGTNETAAKSGSSRGEDTNVGLALTRFLARQHGIGGYPPGGFGGTEETPLSADERRYVCSVQTSLPAPEQRADGYVLVIARSMAVIMGRPAEDIAQWLEDASLCSSFIAARTPKQLIARTEYTVFPVDGTGMPLSSNVLWNACIRSGHIPLAMARANTDIDEHGRPRTCADYHTGGSWTHPDFAGLYFTYDKETGTLTVPDSYVVMRLQEVI